MPNSQKRTPSDNQASPPLANGSLNPGVSDARALRSISSEWRACLAILQTVWRFYWAGLTFAWCRIINIGIPSYFPYRYRKVKVRTLHRCVFSKSGR